MQDTARSSFDLAFGAAFLVALAVPGLVAAVHGPENVARAARIERRRPVALPGRPATAADAVAFPGRFDAWFEDAWGGREAAVRANARASMELFGTSPAEHLVFGPRDWVFSREHRAFESFAGVDPLSDATLRDWQRALEDRRRWLAERGAEHLVVLVPHKSSIYPEELPRRLAAARGQSRREQFVAWMSERSDVRVVDVAPALTARKALDAARQHVYSPHGVHWTAVGAHAAYEVIAGILADELGAPPPAPLESFDVIDRPGEGDSWASRMALDGVLDMENLVLQSRVPTGVVAEGRPPGGGAKDRRWTHPDATRPRIVVAHDSFGPDLLPVLAQSASVLESRWRAFLEPGVVERVEPDVVIELYSELALVTQTPFRRPEFLGADVEGGFESAPLLARGSAGEIPPGRGVRYFDLGGVDSGTNVDVLLGLDLETERGGIVAVFRGDRITRETPVSQMLPMTVDGGRATRVVPLIRAESGAHTWLVLPEALGAVRVHATEFRASTER